MYKASLALVGVAGVSLLLGWRMDSNPATYVAIAASILAGLLLFASWILDRMKGGSATAESGTDSSSGTWTPPPDVTSSSVEVGASSPAPPPRTVYGRAMPTFRASTPARSPSDTMVVGPVRPRGMAGPTGEGPAELAPTEEPAPRRRFGRKAAPAPSSRHDDAVADLQALSASASEQLRSMEDEPELPEVRLARASEETERLLQEPDELEAGGEEPSEPSPAPVVELEPSEPAAVAGPTSEQDEWLNAAMRRRKARASDVVGRPQGAGEAATATWSLRRRRGQPSQPEPASPSDEIPPETAAVPADEPAEPPAPVAPPAPAEPGAFTSRRHRHPVERAAATPAPAEPEPKPEAPIAPWPQPAPEETARPRQPAPPTPAPATPTRASRRPASSFGPPPAVSKPAPKPALKAPAKAPAAKAAAKAKPAPAPAAPPAAKRAAKPAAKPATKPVPGLPTKPLAKPAAKAAAKAKATPAPAAPRAAKRATKPATKPVPGLPAKPAAKAKATPPKASAKSAPKPKPPAKARPKPQASPPDDQRPTSTS